jgi:predicted GIY-YIG superfamily endonuclease
MGLKRRRARPHHFVYVVELDPGILQRKKFREANPNYVRGKDCLYVGMTGLTPERRFQNHKRGYRANSFVRDYGWHLRADLYPDGNPFPYAEAVKQEAYVARELRRLGYGVWQH